MGEVFSTFFFGILFIAFARWVLQLLKNVVSFLARTVLAIDCFFKRL